MSEQSAWTKRFKDVMPFGSSTASKAPVLEPDEDAVASYYLVVTSDCYSSS